jgi:hypothetical protein
MVGPTYTPTGNPVDPTVLVQGAAADADHAHYHTHFAGDEDGHAHDHGDGHDQPEDHVLDLSNDRR